MLNVTKHQNDQKILQLAVVNVISDLNNSVSAVRFGRVPKREKAKITAAMESSRLKNMENRVMAEMADDAKIIETVVRAHFDSCDYTADKIKPFIAKATAEKQFTQCTGMVSTEHLYTDIHFNCNFSTHKSAFDNPLNPLFSEVAVEVYILR